MTDWSKFEEQYLERFRKDSRQERKRASRKDRSLYKKTDQDQLKKQQEAPPKKGLKLGRVFAIISEGIKVQCEDSNYLCTLRGNLKKDRRRLKNLVIVGDMVNFEEAGHQEGVIWSIEERRSVLSRADNLSRQKEQLIAANVDQVLITASLLTPPLRPTLLDRYIVAAQRGRLTPIIVITKTDLLETNKDDPILEEQKALLDACLNIYPELGIPTFECSLVNGDGIDPIRAVMADKVSVVSGQSGVGKSSLINQLFGMELLTGDTVKHTRKGSHTTTQAQLLPLPSGGWCIDTPGIKSFGIWDVKSEELESYFAEIHEKGLECKYPSCRHIGEVGCAVETATETGEISPLRLASYRSLLDELDSKHLGR